MEHNEPPQNPQQELEQIISDTEQESWETQARKAPKDPMPIRLCSILVLLFGAWNVLSGITAIIAWVAGDASLSSLGVMTLHALLLPIGLLQIVSGIMLLKTIGQRENSKLKELCRTLGISLLIVSVAYIVSTVMVQGFSTSTLSGPIVAIAYLTVQRYI